MTLLGGTLLATWSGTSIRLLPVEQTPRAAPLTFVPNHSDERYLPETWHPFGGIDAEISTHGRSVTLDTQDTTDTWTTKWSGVEMSGPATCSVTISGRVRDMSHRPGVPGGYGIGLAKVDRSQAVETLYGSAVQYDFGQQGYRLAEYPSDTDTGLIVASLDNGWHSFVVRIDSAGFAVFELDGVEVVNGGLTPTCGQPVIRVWAGAAEFTDLDIKR
ncbi:hypothetical protein [Mycolicibacterium austroafricanum]|uniref:hypothetical protein n=1 Tax=Mycolicibacterium austroafricanum TaxID=39687 RepID=UPI001ABF9574|nr:hypothetical protein [Mycolicibacterium austroafricanum]QRZ08163.1 hypothetical protein JN090_06410 [Mycolicibacterium austroafricanum]